MGYQGTMVRQTPIAAVSYVPTPQELAGNFSICVSGVSKRQAGDLESAFRQ